MLTLTNICRLPTKLRRRARRRRMATLWLLALLALIVLVPVYAVYKPPTILLRHLARRWPDVLWQVDGLPADRRVVALTIDDAPSDQTPEILRLLREHGARATFFVIGGQVEEDGGRRREVLRQIVHEGHELGNHAMHDEAARSLNPAELEEQILHVQELLRDAYAESDPDSANTQRYQYYRPGSGFFTDSMRKLVARLGYRLVLGSIYPHDAQITNWRLNARHILSMLKPGRIIICHDRRSWTVPMLSKVLPEAKRRGYRFVTVTELLLEAEEVLGDT